MTFLLIFSRGDVVVERYPMTTRGITITCSLTLKDPGLRLSPVSPPNFHPHVINLSIIPKKDKLILTKK